MTSRRSTACFARSLSAAAALLALAAAIRAEHTARACAGGETTIEEVTTFDPRVIGEPALVAGVFFDPWHSGFGGFDTTTDADAPLADWRAYLKDTGVADATWKHILYDADATELAALRARPPSWAKPAGHARLDAALAFVQLARGLEASAGGQGLGAVGATRPIPTAKLLADANAGVTANAGDPFLAQRYAFQAVRALFYQQDFTGVIAYVDRQTAVLAQPSASLNWRARYYLAGALRQTNDIARQSLELARIQANYAPLAGAAASDFRPGDDANWRRALDLAKTPREKAELWRLVGMRFDGLAAIREIVKLDPRSDLLAVLVVRELARAESVNGGVYSVADIGSDQQVKRHDDEAALDKIVGALAATPGVDRKWLLDLVAGHLAALRGDVATARARTAAAVAARPRDARVADQAKASVALALSLSWRFDAGHEADLGRAMALGSDFDRAGAVDDYVRRALAPAYAKAGRFVDAEYLVPGSVDQETEYSRFEGRPGQLHWAKTSFILDMIMRFDRRATEFDRFVLAHPPFTKPQLEQELGLRYLLDGDFAAAQQTFQTTDALSQRLHTDPFVIHIRDCHDCDHDKYANAAWTHGSFVAKMAELAKAAQGTGDAAAQAALQLGIGFYNMSWYGNARSILGDDTHQDTHDAKPALKWFARAFDLAKDRELKAKAAYFAAKAEAGDRLDVAYDPNATAQPAWAPVTWFAKLQTLKDTRYYKDVLGECGVFADWASARAP